MGNTQPHSRGRGSHDLDTRAGTPTGEARRCGGQSLRGHGESEAALQWLLKGYSLDPDGDGRTAPAWEQEYVTERAKRIAGDPLLTLVLTAWDVEVRLRNGGSDTDGPVGIAVAPVVSMLSKLDTWTEPRQMREARTA